MGVAGLDGQRDCIGLDISDDQKAALIRELHDIIESDKFPFSSRIMTLKMIGNVLRRCGCRLR
jgi:hypothetical protein